MEAAAEPAVFERMTSFCYYVGLDVHRKTISYCSKRSDGTIAREGKIESTRAALSAWAREFDAPWSVGLEATICSHWIYWHLKALASEVVMGQPAKLKAISTAKRKNDSLDARMLADLLRCELFPACYVPPQNLELLRRKLRHRALLVRTHVMLKNKISGLLIAAGVEYETQKLHGQRYFAGLLRDCQETDQDLTSLLRFDRRQIDTLEAMEEQLVEELVQDPILIGRVQQLRTIQGVGPITALTWALETGEPSRFPNERHAISYCGLCAAQRESAGKQQRGPLSKQRNHFLQTTLIEAAHIAKHFNPQLRALYEAALNKGPKHRATLEIARRLVRQLLAIDRCYFKNLQNAA